MTYTADYVIGIDPGTRTGVAIYDVYNKRLTKVVTSTIWEALKYVHGFCDGHRCLLRVENPNTWRKFRGTSQKEADAKKQGAGSIKRDFAIWEDFAKKEGIPFEGASLHSSMKKLDEKTFERYTGWKGRTSKHARDAAMLCWGHSGRYVRK
jgi:hypothetical protein